MRALIAILIGISATVAIAQGTQWPPLPTTGVVVGRAATKADVDADRAVFVAADGGRVIGRPLDIAIPQYAYRIDGGKRTPVVVIQAEEAKGQRLIGARTLQGEYVAGLITDFELLGTRAPNRAP